VFHKELWDDSVIKNIHYIITPKPWEVEEDEYEDTTGTFKWWCDINKERLTLEGARISTPPS
jgi:inositol 3-alpha-galactosyltransferase